MTDDEMQVLLSVVNRVVDQKFEYKDYTEDRRFRVGWMRVAEAEAYDLQHSTKCGACPHGQIIYNAVFHVIEQFLGHHTLEQLREMIGTLIEEPYEEDEEDEYESEEEQEETRTFVIQATVGAPRSALQDGINPI